MSGYPYLDLARDIHADYGHVLSFSDLEEKRVARGGLLPTLTYWQQQALDTLTRYQQVRIIETIKIEKERRLKGETSKLS